MTDTLQPNVLTVNPDGTIGANITGHVAAQGVDLQEGTIQTPPANQRVRWLRQSDGAAVASLYATSYGGDILGAQAGGNVVDVIDSIGGSSFLQLKGPLRQRMAIGAGTVQFAGGTTTPAAIIAHGLGIQPAAWIQPYNAPGGVAVTMSFTANANNLYISGSSSTTPGTVAVAFYWLAIATG